MRGQAVEPPKAVFTLDFSQGANAVSSSGAPITPRVEGSFILQDSAHGKAMLSGPGAGYLHFPAKDIINPQEGTVEMWVSPVDWKGADNEFHVFFDARGQGALYLYKYWSSSKLLMLSAPSTNGPYHSASGSTSNWKPGEWYFIAGTWSPTHLSVYVDGKLVGIQNRPQLPAAITGEFEIGDDPWKEPTVPRKSQSLVTKIRIYDRMLSPQHIAAHFEGDYNKTVPLTPDSPSMQVSHDINKRQLTSTLNVFGVDTGRVPVKAEFSLRQNGKIIQKNTSQDIENVASSTLSTENLEKGTYQVVADVSAGEQRAQVTRDFVVPDTSWIGNNIGKEDKVLPPWTPLQVDTSKNGVTVTCWGRTYQFQDSAFPSQIVSQDQPLLSSPINLKVLSNQQKLRWNSGRIQVQKSTPTHVLLSGTAEADTPNGKLRLASDIRIDFDGFTWLSVKLQAPQGFKADSVSLDIPMRDKNAIYRHNWSGRTNNDYLSGLLPAGTGTLQENVFQPYSWLGDNDRGLLWFSESAEHWPNFKSKAAFQVRRENDSVTTHLNLLDGQNLPQEWNFEFGLQATPVKPLSKDWRKWRFSRVAGMNAAVPWPSSRPPVTRYFGYPEPHTPAGFQQILDVNHAEGKAVVPYLLLNAISDLAPEWTWFDKKWDSTYGETTEDVSTGFLRHIPPTAEYWQDFIIWKTKQFLDNYRIAGAYHDLTYVFGWDTPATNSGWFDGKEWQKTYPMRAYRELYKRNYALFKDANPNSFLWAHNSPIELIPVLAYEDAYLSGETLRNSLIGKESHMDVLSLDQWRVEYTGRQWGVIPYILPELHSQRTQEVPSRALATLAMLHDTMVWATAYSSNMTVFSAMYEALDKFDYVDSTFLPYWSQQPPATTAMKDVYVSGYKREDGCVLLVVGNTAREPRSGNITLNPKTLGLTTTQVLSWPEGAPLNTQGDTVSVSMDGLDYRLLLVKGVPQSK